MEQIITFIKGLSLCDWVIVIILVALWLILMVALTIVKINEAIKNSKGDQ